MLKESRVAVSHPGKLGDIILALPCVKSISEHHRIPVTFVTSFFAAPLVSLLRLQPFIKEVVIDESYTPIHEHRGYQPHTLSEDLLSKFDISYELGYRESDAYEIEKLPIRGYPYFILKEEYGLELNNTEPYKPCLSLPFEGGSNEPYLLFQGFGETLDMVLGVEKVNRIMAHWAAVLKSVQADVRVFTGPREARRYRSIGMEPVVSYNLLDAVIALISSRGFLGAQSILSAISNELSHNRMIFTLFPNAMPDTGNASTVALQDMSDAAADAVCEWVKECVS